MNIQLDDGVQFGLGVFETICLRDGKPEFLDWHLERMNDSLQALGIDQKVTREEVEAWLAAADPASFEELQALKIMVSAKNKIMTLRHNPYTDEKIARGFKLDFSKVRRNDTSPLVYHKTMNYGDNILEKRRTRDLPIDEVIFLNMKGQICEGSTTNVFFVKNGGIFTPMKRCGLLPGVMRRFVMEHFPTPEMILYPETVDDAEECFVTNSLMGIMPVTQFGDREFPIGPVTREVMDAYRKADKY